MRKIVVILLFLSTVFAQDLYYFSCRMVVQNNVYASQRLTFSRLMSQPKSLKKLGSFTFKTQNDKKNIKINDFIKTNQDLIFEKISKFGVFLNTAENVQKNSHKTKNVIVIFPIIVGIIVKDNFVIITLYKEGEFK